MINFVKYKTKKFNGGIVSATICPFRSSKIILVGTGECMACSYCLDKDDKNNVVKCGFKCSTKLIQELKIHSVRFM